MSTDKTYIEQLERDNEDLRERLTKLHELEDENTILRKHTAIIELIGDTITTTAVDNGPQGESNYFLQYTLDEEQNKIGSVFYDWLDKKRKEN